ncbi:hypothetical protein BVJ53_10035 [Lacticaseibacillus chiayiensis]|uniref:Uncharacterized protein n=1 Tax=Lacticaseibacillus chiayiensis TaxID=2100821 RepID=A0A4Q1TRS3_9LACO|nr:hypothetical protein BVJ53_10035 [Lacticaseibacillus chiayiensis]RXT58576.1 hypothetical protein CHT97_05810 [Lacticaseibacillus chiayiensis]
MEGKVWVCLPFSITRSPAQKSACKDPRPQWPKTSHCGLGPLTLRFLTGLAHAHTKKSFNDGDIGCPVLSS